MFRHFSRLGHVVLPEFPLANGRRADLLTLDRKGQFTLIEIKSSIEDFRVDRKWHEYRGFCDRFSFATSPNVPAEIFPETEGLFIADSYGAEELREAAVDTLAAASRKALTLRFARLATMRFNRAADYALSNGIDLPVDPDETDEL